MYICHCGFMMVQDIEWCEIRRWFERVSLFGYIIRIMLCNFGMIQKGPLLVLQLNIDLAKLREDYIPFKMCYSQNLYIYILVCGDDMVWNSGIINDSNNLMLSVGILINVVHISHMFANVCHVCDMLAICLPDLPYIYIYAIYMIYIYTHCV